MDFERKSSFRKANFNFGGSKEELNGCLKLPASII